MASLTDPLPSGELAAFVATYEAGSVQGGADALVMTQSAVTKRIQALERKLGSVLFSRGRQGLEPTSLGHTIYVPAKEALAQLQLVALAAEAELAGSRAQLQLSASLTIGEFLLPAWLSAFRLEQHGVHPQLEVVNSGAVLNAVENGHVAIGFVEGSSVPPHLESLVLAHDELVVVVAAEHRWAARKTITTAALAGEPYLTRERDSGTRAVATAALAAHGITLTPALEVASTQSLKRMIRAGGFSILSRLAIAEEERNGLLVGRPLRELVISRELRAVRRPPSRNDLGHGRSAAQSFWSWLQARTAEGSSGPQTSAGDGSSSNPEFQS